MKIYFIMKKLVLFSIVVLALSPLYSQDGKQTFTRKVLLEQFTTAQCGYCPAGAERIGTAISGNNNVIWIRFHAGFRTDDLTNDVATAMTRFYGPETFAPAIMIDRTRFNSGDPGPVFGVGDVSDIRYAVTSAKSVDTYCKVQTPELTYDPSSRHLSGSVNGRFSDRVFGPSTRIQLFIIEDSILMAQSDYNPVPHTVNYWHMGAVRDVVTPLWGDELSVNEDDNNSFTYQVDYTLPDNFVYKNCRLVAIVYNYNPDDINDCQVLNAAISNFFDRNLGVGEVSESLDIRLFPNPVANHVFIESDDAMEALSIVDATGRLCLKKELHGEHQSGLDISSLSAGMYVIRVSSQRGLAVRSLVVR